MAEIGYTTQLAIQRTYMAADRTLMAWIRTAMSMISFGFTIYKVVDGLGNQLVPVAGHLDGRQSGLILSGLGVVCISVGIIEYVRTVQGLREHDPSLRMKGTLLIAGSMLFIGLAIFVVIWTRVA
jgi:putative membrane protein